MKRVLVVDDELDIAQTVALLLKGAGHNVSYAVTAQAALELAAKQPPDVIVLDLVLPDMDGISLAQRLKSLNASHVPKIIAITGRAGDVEASALASGCDRFLRKPVDPATLNSLIEA